MSRGTQADVLFTAPVPRRQAPSPLAQLPLFQVLVGATVLVTALLVSYPLARLVLAVFVSDGSLGVSAIVQTLTMPLLPPALVDSAILVLAAGSGAIVIGAAFAWLNERTDARMGWLADMLPILPLMVPQVAIAIGWVILLAPRAGFLNVFFRSLVDPTNAVAGSGPITIYSMLGLIWVTAVVTVPVPYLTLSAALRNLDPDLEEASRMCGEPPLGTLRKVTLPAVRNALVTAVALVVITILSLFSVPIIVGVQGGVNVLAVLVFRVLNSGSTPRFDQAIVLSVFMLAAVQAAIFVEHAVTRTGHHARIGGKGRARTRSPLGPWRAPARAAMLAYLLVATVLPVLALAFISLQGFWSPAVAWDKLSLANYAEMFGTSSRLGLAFVNSLILGLSTATILMTVAAVVAYYVSTSAGRIARLVDVVTGLPAGVPHVVIGVAFLVALGSGIVSLSGTLALLFLAYFALLLPQASRIASAALNQVGLELWESSLACGASRLRTFGAVLVPLMLPSLLAGWAIVFAHAFSETSASVFLSSPTANPVSGAVIVDVFRNNGTFPQVAALCVCVTLIQSVVVLGVQLAGRQRLGYLAAR